MSALPRQKPAFSTTRWSLVLALREESSKEADEALAELCRCYWFPLYAYVRRRGCSPEDAEDDVQGFIAEFLTKRYFARADPQRGRFRTFLLSSMSHYLSKGTRNSRRLKRGGGLTAISWDRQTAEDRYQLEPVDEDTPESVYDRQCARLLMDGVLKKLQTEFQAQGKSETFEALSQFLWGESSRTAYKDIASQMKMSVGAVTVAVHRLRHRFRNLLRNELAETVADPNEVDDELRHLISVVRQ